MKKIINLHLKAAALALMLLLTFPAHGAEPEPISAKDDYVTCWKQPCVMVAGSEWSEKNPNSVGVAVRMGTEPIATDDEINLRGKSV